MKTSREFIKWTTVSLLTFGASLFLGLLSFSGMYVLWPMTSLALLSFFLSAFYEGEIYQKNITKALDKLSNKDLVLEKIGQEIAQLLEQSPNLELSFLEDYKQVKSIKDPEERAARLQKMHIWLGKLLIESKTDRPLRPIQEETLGVIKQSQQYSSWLERVEQIKSANRNTIIFSVISTVAMSLGTAYLLIDALEVLPFFSLSPAVLPFVLIPISIISGIAYGFLTYNSLSDFFLNSNITNWWEDFKKTFSGEKNLSPTTISYAIFSGLIIMLNLALTVCTAGTWWTVVNQQRNLWSWLQNGLTKLIEKTIPLVMGLSTLGFNLKNTIDTIKHLKPADHHHEQEHEQEHEHDHSIKTETIWQKLNIFRFILKLTYMPIRILLFIGHLVSIGVTGDRMPGISPITSAILGIISEGFEDTDYFFDLSSLSGQHSHEHGEHDHVHSDLPNLVLQMCFMPLFLLAALWHRKDSELSFNACLRLMLGWEHPHQVTVAVEKKPSISKAWVVEESCAKVDDEIVRLSNASYDKPTVSNKITILREISTHFSQLAHQIRHEPEKTASTKNTLNELMNSPVLNMHRFWKNDSPTNTKESIQEILTHFQKL